MERLRQLVDRVIFLFIEWMSLLLASCVIWQVISRTLGQASPSTDEIARFLLVWCGAIGMAYMVGKCKHLSIDLVSPRLSSDKKRLLAFLAHLVILFFSVGVLVYGGFLQVQNVHQMQRITPVLGIRIAWIYAVVPISGILMCFYTMANLFDVLKGKLTTAGGA